MNFCDYVSIDRSVLRCYYMFGGIKMLKVYLIYTAVVTLLTLALFIADKLLSKNEILIRLPEELLLAFTCLGGSLGALAGIYIIRHKTSFKTKFHFIIGTWLAFAVQASLAVITALSAGGYIGGKM